MGKYEDEKYDFDDYEEVYYEDENYEDDKYIYDNDEDEIYEDYTDSEEIANDIDSKMLEKEIRNSEEEKTINNLAKIWSDLNSEIKNGNGSKSKEKELQNLRDKIMTKVFNLYKNSYAKTNEKHKGVYETDLITINKYGDKIKVEKFYRFLHKSLDSSSVSCYNVEKNDNYLAYFRTIIKRRSKDSKTEIERKKKKEEKVKIVPLYVRGREGNEFNVADAEGITVEDKQCAEEGYIKLLVPVMRLCEINLRNSKLTDNKKTKRWLFYRMQYTFDIVKGIEEIKTRYIPPSKLTLTEENHHENMTPQELEEYCACNEEFYVFKKKNYEIYRNMRLALVEILKEGNIEDFTDMLDIVRRCLRTGVNLNKRQEYIAEGLAKDDEYSEDDVSRTTINKYVKFYKEEIMKALKSDQLTD